MSPRQSTRLSILFASIGLALLAAASGASAQTASSAAGTNAGASLAADDKAFVQKAAVGNLAEVELGRLAQQNGASDGVKQFGARMVDDHSKAGEELSQIAGTKGLAAPSVLDAKHQDKLAKMQKLSGAASDRAYMDDMLADHKEDIALFKKEASSGHDGELKSYAAKTLPTLEDHLKLAQSTAAAAKGAKSSAGR